MRIINVLLLALLASTITFADDTPLRGDAEQARAAWPLIEEGALVIDVRSTEEFESGHLPGAVHVPYQDTDALTELIGPDPDRTVVLYCGSGRRAENAREALEGAGFNQVYNASGLDALLATQPEGDQEP